MIITLDDEVKKDIAKKILSLKIIGKWDYLSDFLSNSFTWSGSKINWNKTKNHKTIFFECGLKPDVALIEFIIKNALDRFIMKSNCIYYINDSSLDFALNMSSQEFYENISYILNNIPQHHYFFNLDQKWCLTVTMEGDIDFGFSLESTINL